MTPEELRAFELEHPEYRKLFYPMLAGFNEIVREEFSKAFKAIDERLTATKIEHVKKYNMPEEDAKILSEAFIDFLKQADSDFREYAMSYYESKLPGMKAAMAADVQKNSEKTDQ
ncbi:MAG: hypothetical protein IKE16_07800 [Solobacterium sp.]|nr:hypothetical protein [Solobacterium sp.]